jgi:hypothetical protein
MHNFTPLFFALISFEPTKYLLNLLAMKTHQINVPEWLAKIIRRGNLQNSSATQTRGIYSPEISAIATRGIDLPENPPSPLRIPRQDPAHRPPPLPPLTPYNRGGGRGRGTDPARPDIVNRYFSFPFISFYIFNMTQHIRILHRAD